MVLSTLEDGEVAALTCRIGWLNGIFNPMKPDGHYMFNLGRHIEERTMFKILACLSKEEPAQNWEERAFRWSFLDSDSWSPAWELRAEWLNEDAISPKGIVKFTYTSSNLHDKRTPKHLGSDISTRKITEPFKLIPPLYHQRHLEGDGFTPIIGLRRALCYFTVIDERLLVPDEDRHTCLERYSSGCGDIPPGVEYMESDAFMRNKPGMIHCKFLLYCAPLHYCTPCYLIFSIISLIYI